MVEEPSHVKQLSLNKVCKIGLKQYFNSTNVTSQNAASCEKRSFLNYDARPVTRSDLFRNSMQGKEHMNFQAVDPRLGPALLSVKDISCQGGPKVYAKISQ
jgi:hypothetical protein